MHAPDQQNALKHPLSRTRWWQPLFRRPQTPKNTCITIDWPLNLYGKPTRSPLQSLLEIPSDSPQAVGSCEHRRADRARHDAGWDHCERQLHSFSLGIGGVCRTWKPIKFSHCSSSRDPYSPNVLKHPKQLRSIPSFAARPSG